MPTYRGINGIVHKLKEWPVGIGGVVKQQKEVWAGVDGVTRKIFSGEKKFNVYIKNDNSNDSPNFANNATVTIDGVTYTYQYDGTILSVLENTEIKCVAAGGGVYVNGSQMPGSSYYGYTYMVESDIEILIQVQVIVMPDTSFSTGTIRINTL